MEWLTGKSISSLVAILLLALLAKKAETILKNSKKIYFLHFHTEQYSPYVREGSVILTKMLCSNPQKRNI